ncbi:hypothetical protein CGLAUT_07965 [Corynebacterium glaucum]|uniref:hypothetical protein n=1 Tax=Corynebacterium glaucum TaxID=187491 RepID=UPI0025B38411|nr:hypothetical protein [Corynebacterium glaucum]WJZ08074.1 hypothetical protein CGLAUT_07965 [Corynebacterium glaucum]
MPAIVFDVLVPPTAADEVGAAFQRALDILVRRGKLTAGSVVQEGTLLIDATVHAQLTSTYEADRGTDPADDGAQVHRYVITAEGADSYNRLAMGLSRILTPKATLPNDPAALEQQDQFEVASIYPWTVEVRR